MNLARSRMLDALCGEYLLGTLRGLARRRFERAVRTEPMVAVRLDEFRALLPLDYAPASAIDPSPETWRRLERELGLGRFRMRWHRRLALWRGLAIGATAALVLAIGVQTMGRIEKPTPVAPIAHLEGKARPAVTAALSADGRTLELQAERPVIAGPAHSYELWLLPEAGGAPLSLAVLGSLDTRVTLPEGRSAGVRRGARLAISVEPAGGSATGRPTGPVILVGEIRL